MKKIRLPNWIREIKWWFQRANRGWADCDWWNIDSYICKIMEGMMLRMLMDGCHIGCGIDWIFEGNGMTEEERDLSKRTHNLYKRILRFFEYHKMFSDNPKLWKNKMLVREYKASGLLFIRNFGRLWD